MSALAGTVAVITGASSGIGAALARAFVGAGATVCGVGRDVSALEAVGGPLGDAFVPLRADLAVPVERARLAGDVLARFERVGILVNNAADCVYETPLALAPGAWSRLFETNVLAAIDLARSFATRMRAGDRIVNVGSVTARHLPSAAFGPYASTKVALASLTEALRLELAPRGIGLTTIAPGLVDTPLYAKVPGFERMRAKLDDLVPRWLRPEEVADAVLWAVTRPRGVVVADLVVMPEAQAR